jgi:hypothetical protein
MLAVILLLCFQNAPARDSFRELELLRLQMETEAADAEKARAASIRAEQQRRLDLLAAARAALDEYEQGVRAGINDHKKLKRARKAVWLWLATEIDVAKKENRHGKE